MNWKAAAGGSGVCRQLQNMIQSAATHVYDDVFSQQRQINCPILWGWSDFVSHVESGSFDHPRGLRGRQRRGQEDRWPSDRNRLRTLAALVTEPGRKPLTGCCVFRKSLLKSVCMRPCDWMALRHHVFVRGHLQEWTSRDYSERSRQSYHALLCGLYR